MQGLHSDDGHSEAQSWSFAYLHLQQRAGCCGTQAGQGSAHSNLTLRRSSEPGAPQHRHTASTKDGSGAGRVRRAVHGLGATPLPGARPLQPYTALPTMDPGARPHQPCKIHHEPRRTPTPAMHFLPPTPGPNDSGWLSTPAPGAVRIWRWPGHALAPDNTRPDAVQPAVGAGRHMGRKHLSPQHQTCTPQ